MYFADIYITELRIFISIPFQVQIENYQIQIENYQNQIENYQNQIENKILKNNKTFELSGWEYSDYIYGWNEFQFIYFKEKREIVAFA